MIKAACRKMALRSIARSHTITLIVHTLRKVWNAHLTNHHPGMWSGPRLDWYKSPEDRVVGLGIDADPAYQVAVDALSFQT